MLERVQGVDEVQFEPFESTVTVNFDGDQTGLSDLVRVLEGLGHAVCGVAQRRSRAVQPG